jgi:hypothetical protein
MLTVAGQVDACALCAWLFVRAQLMAGQVNKLLVATGLGCFFVELAARHRPWKEQHASGPVVLYMSADDRTCRHNKLGLVLLYITNLPMIRT